MNRCLLLTLALAGLAPPASAATIIAPTEDVMTSAFFFGEDHVRGYSGEGRRFFRVGSDNAFGIGPETAYLAFNPADFDLAATPVASATLTMQSTADDGFSVNASPTDPFNISAHAVDADPLQSITDDTNPAGGVDWRDFFEDHILPADADATTTVDGIGAIEFDVTSIVNAWIGGANTEFFIAITGKNDPQTGNDGNGFLHAFLDNSETPGATYLTITPIPEPASVAIGVALCLAVAFWSARPIVRVRPLP